MPSITFAMRRKRIGIPCMTLRTARLKSGKARTMRLCRHRKRTTVLTVERRWSTAPDIVRTAGRRPVSRSLCSCAVAQRDERFDPLHQDVFIKVEMIAVQRDAGAGAKKEEDTGHMLQIPGK